MSSNSQQLDPPADRAAGAPSGDSRLSAYFVVIGTVIVTVVMLTVTSMNYLETDFGSKGSAVSTVSGVEREDALQTVHLRVGENNNNNNNNNNKHESFELDTIEAKIKKKKKKKSRKNNKNKNKNKNKNGDGILDENNNGENEDAVRGNNNEEIEPESESETFGGLDEVVVKEKVEKESTANDEQPKPTTSTTTSSMLDSVVAARHAMIQKLKVDYGDEYFERIFRRKIAEPKERDELDKAVNPERLEMEHSPFRAFGPKDLYHTRHFSREKMEDYRNKTAPERYHSETNVRRKMMIKVLRAVVNPSNNNNKYVWASGGHSAAAGHGNLFKETYTKVMEAAASNVFRAAGLELDARNYAMGATSSAAEMSMCFEEVYGDDVDFFSWDFGMLEARDYLNVRLLHYAMRGFLSNQQQKVVPAFIALQEVSEARRKMMTELHEAFRGESGADENNGLALFLSDKNDWNAMKEAIPETSGLGEAEINKLPELVRYYKCEGQYEKGDPYCTEKKYTDEICPGRIGAANWHPGWKAHALVGNAMALFLTEILEGAVRQIEDEVEGPEDLLSRLLREEDVFREKLFGAPISELPESFQKIYWYNNTEDNAPKNYDEAEKMGLETGSDDLKAKWSDLDREALFRGPSVCHTARIPAQTRFFGYLTNTEMAGQQAVFGNETYFTGISDKAFHEQNEGLTDPTPHDIQLVWTMRNERQEGCGEELAKPDYHDFFMAEDPEGWTTLTFPNPSEQAAYGFHEKKDKYRGMLIIVPRFCGFGQCEQGFLGHNEYNSGKWTIKVNGKTVTALTLIGHEAVLLEHEDGIIFDPNADGIYKLELKVNEPEHFIKISAFILY